MRRFRRELTGVAVALLALFTLGAAEAAELQRYGQSAVRITTDGGKVILVDPFITKNPKTPEALKDLGQLGKVDLILVTHGHGDHVGGTAEIARMTGAKAALGGYPAEVIDLEPGGKLKL